MVFTFSVMLMFQSLDLNVNVSWKKLTNPTSADYANIYTEFDKRQYMHKKTCVGGPQPCTQQASGLQALETGL